MASSKRFLAILTGDKKLLGMFGGIVIDVAVLVAILVMACVWYLLDCTPMIGQKGLGGSGGVVLYSVD